MHTLAERGEDAHPPVADLVAEAFDHHRPVVGDGPGGLELVVEVGHEVLGGPGIEADLVLQAREGRGATRAAQLPREGADRAPQLQRASRLVALPERHLPRLTGRRGHHDPVARDVLDPPARRSQQEDLAATALVHHLLIELAHPGAVRQEHAEQTTVGDRAARGDGEAPGAVACAHDVMDAIPDDARSQLREAVGGVASGQQVEHGVEHLARELREVGRAPDRAVEVVDGPRVHRAHRHELLGEHVERVARVAGLLDLAGEHALGHHRGLQEVAAELREDLPAARLAHLVPGAPDALQPARHGTGRLDLDHEVHGAHVDAELQRGRGDDRAERARLQGVLHLQSLLPRERSVVRAHEILAGQLVQPRGEPFGEAPRVHEHDGGAVRADQLEQARVDRRPDRRLRRSVPRPRRTEQERRRLRRLRLRAELRHVLHRHDDLELHRLAVPGIDDGHGPRRAVVGLPPQEPRDLLQRALRRGQPDPLGWRHRRSRPGAPATGRGARRAWWRPGRGSRRRSPIARCAGSRAPAR